MKTTHKLTVGIVCVLLSATGARGAGADPAKIKKCTTIKESGAYRVVKNLQAKGDCLVVAAPYVDLYLGGFTLFGDGTGGGVTTQGVELDGTNVRNGTVTEFQDGIDLLSSNRSVVEGVRAVANRGNGIRIGSLSIVTGNLAHGNGGVGINAGGSCRVSGNTSSFNGSHGIEGDGCVVTENASRRNGGDGIKGFVNASTVVIGNAVDSNDGNGITLAPGIVRENAVIGNKGDGIAAGCPTSIIGNMALSNKGLNINPIGAGCVLGDNATN